MRYITAEPIKSLARGGVSLGKGENVTPRAFTVDHWARLLKDGAIVEVGAPVDVVEPTLESDTYPNSEANATKSAIELADKHGLELWSVTGSGNAGRITLGDVKSLMDVEDA